MSLPINNTVNFIPTTQLSDAHKNEVLTLWNQEYPEKLNYQTFLDFDNYLAKLTEQSHILIINESQAVKGWYFSFNRDNKRWFALLIDTSLHGQGFGTQLLNLAKEKEATLNGWVIDHNRDKKRNGESYTSPLNFYLKNGFKILSNNRLELDKISAVQIKWVR